VQKLTDLRARNTFKVM